MKKILVITKDIVKGEAITEPQTFRNIAEAKRSWAIALKKVDMENPENIPLRDYQLWALGEIDTESLKIEAKEEFIANAAEFLN